MPDKLTDKEIVKALECCSINKGCTGCYFNTHETDDMCPRVLMRNTLDLVNRQEKEIERLSFVRTRDAQRYEQKISDQAHTNCLLMDLHSEAIKEVKDLEEKLKTAQAENERLSRITRTMVGEIKAEAYTEFAEELKKRKYLDEGWLHGEHPYVVEEDDIDDVLEEMIGDK